MQERYGGEKGELVRSSVSSKKFKETELAFYFAFKVVPTFLSCIVAIFNRIRWNSSNKVAAFFSIHIILSSASDSGAYVVTRPP